MRFSVIIATYNRRSILPKCLQALRDQSYPAEDYEVMVVDDGSTDGTKEFLESLSANFLTRFQAHRGPAVARNLGVKNSHGVYLAFTDDDCLVPENWLEGLEIGFNQWPQAAAVGGYLEAPADVLKNNLMAKLEYHETHVVYHASDREYLGGFETPSGGTNNIAYRRDIFEGLGGFDEGFPVPAGEDADLKLRAVRAGFKIGYRPVKVTHLDPYSFKTFMRRSIRAGLGSAYFEKKNFQKSESIFFLVFLMFRSVLKVLTVFLFSLGRSRVESLKYLREFLIGYGKIVFILRRNLSPFNTI